MNDYAVLDLCRLAVRDFVRCFDNIDVSSVGLEQAPIIARALMVRGGRPGFFRGRQILSALAGEKFDVALLVDVSPTRCDFFQLGASGKHPIDRAVDIVLAAGGRRVEEIIELARLEGEGVSLAALAWAAAGKALPSPSWLMEQLVRNAMSYGRADYLRAQHRVPIDPSLVVERILSAARTAQKKYEWWPLDHYGELFLDARGLNLVEPDLAALADGRQVALAPNCEDP